MGMRHGGEERKGSRKRKMKRAVRQLGDGAIRGIDTALMERENQESQRERNERKETLTKAGSSQL